MSSGIAILGGGVAGAALAGELARRGRRDVVVYDALPHGCGSTTRALGGFRTQHGSEINVRLSLLSRPWFAARAGRIDFQANGYLYLAENDGVAAELGRRADFQRSMGLPIEHPEPASLVSFLQSADVRAANYCALDGLYRPALILDLLGEEAEAAGVRFRRGVSASPAELEDAEAVVVAAGIWSRELGELLGVRLDVTALERRVWELGPFDWLPKRVPLTLDAGSGYHFRERDSHLLLMGPGDQDDFRHFRAWLSRRVPAAATAEPIGGWTGCYEMTPDLHPLVGRTDREQVWADCGFSGHGVMHAPAIAQCLAAMILGESPALDISALSPLRREALVDLTQV